MRGVLLSVIFILLFDAVLSTTYTIAGVFNPFDVNGNVDKKEAENLAAFRLAIDNINADTIKFPHLNLDYVIHNSIGYAGAGTAADKILKDPLNIVGAVTDLPYKETSTLHLALGEKQMVMVHSFAMNVDFGDGVEYPYKTQTSPIDSFQGMVIQHILCNHFNISRVVIFSSNDMFGTKTTMESGDDTFCPITNLASFTIPDYVEDFTDYISKAQDAHGTVFLLFLGPKQAALLLEQGRMQGLFRQGDQILGHEALADPKMFDYFSPDADIPSIMKGFFAISYWPEYSVKYLDEGREFVSQFRALLPLTSPSACNVVDANNNYIYRLGQISTGACIGLNFANYQADGSDLNAFATLTYDAVYTLAMGLNYTLEHNQVLNGNTLKSAIVNNISFEGASGYVKLFIGMANRGWYGAGDREEGHHYKILNFQENSFIANRNHSFPQVAYWSIENGTRACLSSMNCVAPIFDTFGNSVIDGFPPYAHSTPPLVVKLGGLFAPFNDKNEFNLIQAENLAAFLMAIREINAVSDGIADDLLPSTEIKFAFASGNGFAGAVHASENLIDAFFYSGVHGIVGALPDTETMAADQFLPSKKVVQCHSMAMDTDFGDGIKYPYKVQVSPIDSFQGMVWQHIVCLYYEYSKVTLFYTADNFGSKASVESTDGTFCDIQVMARYGFRSDKTDFSDIIDLEKKNGGQIFILFMGPQSAANLLEQGYKQGLFIEGTQIFVPELILTTEIFDFFDDKSLIPIVMKGMLGVKYWPDYTLTRSDRSKAWLQRWGKQPYTGDVIKGGQKVCNVAVDDSGGSYLYRHQTDSTLCAGLNFTRYLTGELTVNPYAALTYDAVYVLASGLDILISNNIAVNGDNLKAVILNNVTFWGVSGYINIFEGMPSYGFYGRGDREEGHYYRLVNFQASAYAANKSNAWVQVATWSVENGTIPCTNDPTIACKGFIYNTHDNKPARDAKPDIIVTLPSAQRGILFALAAVIFLNALVYVGVIYYYRKAKLVKAAQPAMLYLILFGEIIGGLRVLNAGLDIDTGSCIAGLWFAHMAFAIVFGCLLIKTWRVDRLINNMKRIKITNRDVLLYVSIFVAFFAIYMIVLTVVGQPRKSAIQSTLSNQTTYDIRCSFEYSQLHTALFVLEGVILIYGSRLCWAVKDAPDAVNESKYIAMAITAILMISALVFPVVFLLNLKPVVQQIVASIGFALAALASMNSLFLSKAMFLFEGDDIGDDLKISKKKNKYALNTDIHPEDDNGGDKHLIKSGAAIVASTEALRGKTGDEKAAFIQEQISQWRAILMKVMEANSSGSGSGSGSGSLSGNTSSDLVTSFQNKDDSHHGRNSTMVDPDIAAHTLPDLDTNTH